MQAENACREWIANGPSVVLKFPAGIDPLEAFMETPPKATAREFSWKLRDCIHEVETRQWIGQELYPKSKTIVAGLPCSKSFEDRYCVDRGHEQIDFGTAKVERNFYY